VVAAILWLAFGMSLVDGSGVGAVLVGIIGALGVGIGARMADLASRRSPSSRERRAERSPPARRDYPEGRDLPGR
jgi:hypothetical protein